MAITRVGTQTASAATVTVPAHQKGDLILIWAVRGGSTTAPSLPAGWLSILTKSNSTATTVSARLGWKIATGVGAITSASQNTSTGVWTSASQTLVAGQIVQVTGTLPGGFAANTNYYVMGANLTSTTFQLSTTQWGTVKVPTSSASTTVDTDPSGTWTNAAEICCHVYRPSSGNTLGIGQSASSSSTTATVTYPALSPMADSTSGTAWVAGFVGAGNKTQTLTAVPTGMTNESSVVGSLYEAAGHDTNGGVSSWTSATANVTGTGSTVSATVEIALLPGTAATSLTANVYQHIKGGGNPYANNAASTTPFAYTIPVNWTSGAGNTLIVQISYDGGVTAPSCSGSVNGTYTAGPTALGGVNNTDTITFYKQNVTAGQETLTFTFGVTTRQFGVDAITELYGVATSGGTQGTASSAFSTTTATTSFTPTNNNATGGNFIWASFVQAEQIPAGTTPMITVSGSSFTMMGVDTGWNDSGGDGENFAKAQMGFVQATSAAINPTIVVIGQGGDHWNSLALAFQIVSGAGTAPPSNYMPGVSFISTTHYPASGTYSFQSAMVGNLRLLQSPDPNLSSSLYITDSEGNVLLSDGTSKPAFWYTLGTSANPNLRFFITGGGTDTTLSWRTLDISGGSGAPTFDSAIDVADSIGTVTTYTPTNKISPSNTNGIVVYGLGIGLGPGLAVTAPTGAVWQYPTFTGETDGDLAVNADIGAYYLNTASGSITATFTITNNAGNSSSGAIIAFAWAAGGNVTKALTGQSATFTEGTLNPTLTYSVTGLSAISSEGVLSYAVSYGLTGQSVTSSEGTVTAAWSGSATLGGQSATFAEGSIPYTVSYSPLGQSATFTEGSVTSGIGYPLSGQAATFAEGVIPYEVDYGLTGQVATFTEGSISASQGGNVTLTLSGQAATFAEGSITYEIDYAVTGQSVSSTEGTISPEADYSIGGQAATFGEGLISPQTTGDVTLQLSGLQAIFALGTISVAGADVLLPTDAGSKKRRPTVYIVRVDGKERTARTLADALELLSAAKAQAKREAQEIVRTATEVKEPVVPQVRIPKVTGSPAIREAARETQKEIEQIYRSALMDAEIAMWLEIVKREDTDEDSILLLM